MDSPIFADLQGFVVGERFVAKEVAVLINGAELTHHIFRAPMAWNLLTKTEKTRACWLTANHHQFKWNDGHVDYGSAKRLIRDAIYRGTSPDFVTRIYVKGHEKKKWLLEILGNIAEDRDVIVETIDADYEDIGRLETLDASRAFRCAYHAKNCALENVCKLRDWWMERRDDLNNI
ncbi:hypothetical protein ACFW04_011604 [Cataglyphis niger]